MKKTAAKVLLLLCLMTMTACNQAGEPSATRLPTNGAHTHAFGEWVVTAPTCTADGACVRVCACGEEERETIPALGHDYVGGFCNLCGEKEKVGGLAWTLSADGASYAVTGIGTCAQADIVIAEEYEGVPVTAIADRALRGCDTVQSVFIPASVTYIGAYAMQNCPNLVAIRFGGTLAQWEAIEKGTGWDDGSTNYTLSCADEGVTVTPVLKAGYESIVLSGNQAKLDLLRAMENADRLDPEKLTFRVSDEAALRIDGSILRPLDNSDAATVYILYADAPTAVMIRVRTEKIKPYYLSETQIVLNVGASTEICLFDRFHNAVADVQWIESDDFGGFCTLTQTDSGVNITATRVTEHVVTGGFVYITVRDPDLKAHICKIYVPPNGE